MFADTGYGGSSTACATWNTKHAGKEALATRNAKGYLAGGLLGNTYLAHRVIWCMETGDWPIDQIDHIGGVVGDNRMGKLRDVSASENSRNQKVRCTNKSGIMGVSWREDTKKWRVSIRAHGKRINLGSFSDIQDAFAKRLSAETEYEYHANHGRQEATP